MENKTSETGSFNIEEMSKSNDPKVNQKRIYDASQNFNGNGDKVKSKSTSKSIIGGEVNFGVKVGFDIKYENGSNPNPYSKSGGYYGSRCFIEGTKITMGDGSQKAIEYIKVGDIIKTYNFNLKKTENKKVLLIDSPIHYHFIEMTFSNNIININTEDHPYYVKNKGWASFNPDLTKRNYNLNVHKIELNDVVYFYNDQTDDIVDVKVINLKKISKKMKTYNLSEILDNHNFFANKILVHNKL